MNPIVVVAGASGSVGREVVRALAARGVRVRALSRDPKKLSDLPLAEVHLGDALDPKTLEGLFTGVDRAFSCVGASVSSDPGAGRAGFVDVDVPSNRNLIEAALRAGVRRFVYVSAAGAPEHRDVAYLRAHAEVEELLRHSGLAHAIIRPTGFFSAFEEYLALARKGAVPEIGSGQVKTNPIHPADLAEVCADAVLSEETFAREVGGPQILTRHEVVELAFAALGKPTRVRRVPPGVARVGSALVRPFHPRLGELGQFLAAISSMDIVAEQTGSRRLADHFKDCVARAQK